MVIDERFMMHNSLKSAVQAAHHTNSLLTGRSSVAKHTMYARNTQQFKCKDAAVDERGCHGRGGSLTPTCGILPHVTEARLVLRNAGWLMAQRGLHVVAAAVFAVLVPRLMGPAVYGRYAPLTSVSMWFTLLSDLGAASFMTLSVPQP
jgi:hypothetical protein